MRALLLAAIVVLLAPTAPITKRIVLLVDVSGSMKANGKAQRALEAASAIARQPIDEAAVLPIAWSGDVRTYPGGWENLPSAEAAERVETWLGAASTDGDTYLGPALVVALSRPESDLTIVIVTDGDLHNETTEKLLAVLASGQAKRKQRAVVGVWGIGHAKPRETLLALAKAGGGGYVASGTGDR